LARAAFEREKTKELLSLLDKVWTIPQNGLGKFMRKYLPDMPAWREHLGENPNNQQIASKIGRRLSAMVDHKEIYRTNSGYTSMENARRAGLIRAASSPES